MPAIITHDSFGQDAYKELYETIGGSRDEYEAFLLGNQGPDPLFYSALVPRLRKFADLGSKMHREKTNELILAFKQSLSILDDKEYPIGRAYVLGFLCHYLLDSNMHPLVYFNEYQLCDAGVEDFGRDNGGEVHAVIESELDELVLFTKRGETVASFDPSSEILRGSDHVLAAISKLYNYVALVVYGQIIPEGMYGSALKAFRRTEKVFHSRSGLKRDVLGRIEEVFRPYSFVRSMSPRAIEISESLFDNHEHQPWENPFTGEISDEGFWDIYEETLEKARVAIAIINTDGFDLKAAESISYNRDFSGEPTVAVLTIEENA